MTDLQVKAFNQQNARHSVGPWRGRVGDFMMGAVVFIMNKPDYQPQGASIDDNIVVFSGTRTYQIDEVYDFYGSLMSVTPGSTCMVILQADGNERLNQIVTQ
jgi:hypothetical protein